MADKPNHKKEVTVFGWASFLNDMGTEMIYSIWPIFLTTVLGASMSIVGLIDGIGNALVSISQAVSGYVSDKLRKRKIFIWLGYLFAFAAKIGYGIALTWQQIIPFRVLDRSGKMRDAPRDAIVAEKSLKKHRGENFGFLRMMDNMGALIGISLSIILFGYLGYKKMFILAAIPSLIAVFLIVFLIKEKKEKENEVRVYHGISFKKLDLNLKLFFLSSIFFALGSFSYSFLLIYAKEAGFDTSLLPFLYLIFVFFVMIASLPAGKIADRFGRKPTLLASYVLWILVLFGFLYFKSIAFLICIFAAYGIHQASLITAQKTIVSDLAPTEHRAGILGGFQLIIGICALPSSLIAGLMWDRIGMLIPLYVSIFLTLLAIGVMMLVKERKISQ